MCEASELDAKPIDPLTTKLHRRSDGMSRHAEVRALRRLVGQLAGFDKPYTDDGEYSGEKYGISVDFMRDSVSTIQGNLFKCSLKEVRQHDPYDLLPRVGEEVLFNLASSGWKPFKVLAFTVWHPVTTNSGYRIFVNGIDQTGTQNMRSLGDIRRKGLLYTDSGESNG